MSPGEAIEELAGCVANAYHIYAAFYAIVNRQGIDSKVATGYSYNGDELYLVEFDDFSCARLNQCDSLYTVYECVSPMALGLDSKEVADGNLFSCAEWREINSASPN